MQSPTFLTHLGNTVTIRVASYSDRDIDLYSWSSHRPMVLQDQGLEVGNK